MIKKEKNQLSDLDQAIDLGSTNDKPLEVTFKLTNENFHYSWYERILIVGKVFVWLREFRLKRRYKKINFDGDVYLDETAFKNLHKVFWLKENGSEVNHKSKRKSQLLRGNEEQR